MTAWETADGDRAQQVLDWVNGDPASRAAEGMSRLKTLAGSAKTTAGWREVGDIARVVARLLPEGEASP